MIKQIETADAGNFFGVRDPIVDLQADSVGVAIFKSDAGEYFVVWTDYVANDWVVQIENLPTAMVFAGAILKCGETEGGAILRSLERFDEAVELLWSREVVE